LKRPLLLILVICLGLARSAEAAYIEVAFRAQNGDIATATEWAVEMISDTPIGSTGIFIPNVDPYTGFASVNTGGAPIIGLPGVEATLDAVEDPGTPWGIFNATWFGLPAGLLINAGPGFAGTALGPAGTYLALGLLNATAADIMAGEGVESGLWTSDQGDPLPAGDVQYTLSVEDACDPNPCTSPPAAQCDVDGITLLSYLAEGVCSDLGGGSFSCEYIPIATDCSAQAKLCSLGACRAQPVPGLPRWGIPLLAGLLALAARGVLRRRRAEVA
jgi:hypothetical protein